MPPSRYVPLLEDLNSLLGHIIAHQVVNQPFEEEFITAVTRLHLSLQVEGRRHACPHRGYGSHESYETGQGCSSSTTTTTTAAKAAGDETVEVSSGEAGDEDSGESRESRDEGLTTDKGEEEGEGGEGSREEEGENEGEEEEEEKEESDILHSSDEEEEERQRGGDRKRGRSG